MMTSSSGVYVLLLICVAVFVSVNSLSASLKKQVADCKPDVEKILDHILRGAGKHQTFIRLAKLGDRFGHRLSGSESLERAIGYAIESFTTTDKFDNPTKESVMVPRWTRGREYAFLHVPDEYNWIRPMDIMALGQSVGTNGVNITAEGLVVKSLAELQALPPAQVQGKIVIWNTHWNTSVGYDTTYRVNGAVWAAEHGAVASLIRSVATSSIYSPHTGTSNTATIPGIAITIEDADLMQRIQDRKLRFEITLYSEAQNHAQSESFNAVAEITGTDKPQETVIVGGHIDSWDVTDGSMDDGGGVMMAWEAASVIRKLDLKPRRSIRVVLWTAEEVGLVGSEEYFNRHSPTELNLTSLAMQADQSFYSPKGIRLTGSQETRDIIQEIMNMLDEIKTTQICEGSGRSSDTGWWVDKGVPGIELCDGTDYTNNPGYFDYHHTRGDSMSLLNPDELDHCTAIWASVAYCVASLDDVLPR